MTALHALRNQSRETPEPEPRTSADGQSESALVRRARSEPEAFALLYRRHSPAIQRYLRRRLGDPHLVEDALAETFVSALEALPRYQDRGLPLRSWLYRIANGHAARHRRRAAALAIERLESEPSERPSDDPSERVALAELARAALLRLSKRFQEVLALHYLEGFSLEEIATTVGCRPGTVKSRLARGRAALRKELDRQGYAS